MTEAQRRAAVQLVGGAAGSPLVSVLIVNYNYGAFLAAALDSALAQTYPHREIVVCDDGSTDDSRIVIESYARRHPDVVRPVFKPNGGVASALNAAFEHARGDIICFLDADDLFTPDKLEKVVAAFGQGQRAIGIVVNSLSKLRSSGEVAGLIPQFGRLDRGWLRDKVLATGGHWSYVPTTGISLSRACAEGLFPIPEDEFRTEADSYMYTQAPLFWAVGAIDEPVSVLRLHTSNITSSEGMTVAYARRVTASIERMCHALERTASAHGLARPRLEHNPVYAEMTLIGDYLEGRPRATVLRDLVAAWRAALRCRTDDRAKVMVKPLVLSVVALLPRRLGDRLLQSVYAPTSVRARLARWRGRRWGGRALEDRAPMGGVKGSAPGPDNDVG
jgi:hypothetical protein